MKRTKLKHLWLLPALCLMAMAGGLFASCGDEEVNYVYEEVFDCKLDKEAEYIVVLGDLQNYTNAPHLAMRYMLPTVNWILGMKRQGYKINCVLQTGDLTNDNEDWQYEIFRTLVEPLAREIPFIAVTGNHDYKWHSHSEIRERSSSKLTRYASFPLTCQRILSRFEEGQLENVVVSNTINGQHYDILALEFGPRPEVLRWANDYVRHHRECQFILLTHEFLERRGWRVSNGWSSAEQQFQHIPFSTPQTVWDSLVYLNDNIRCVVCGHNGFSFLNLTKNAAGRKVPQLLFNLQYLPNGGNGMVEIWQLPLWDDQVKVDIYRSLDNMPYTEMKDSIFDIRHAHFRFSL